ncbi:MAG: hypothetical protein JWM93_749 [Frankiales bacterium]|nr:hypothetical protein [Frankiales bacterium]
MMAVTVEVIRIEHNVAYGTSEPIQDDEPQRDSLHRALLAAAALTDPAAVAALTVKHVQSVCGSDSAALYWWDETENVLLPLAVLDQHASRLHQVFHPGQGATGQAFATGSTVLANNYPVGVSFPPAWKLADSVRAVAAVPLIVDGKVSGVLSIGRRSATEVTARDAEAMRVIGEQVAPLLYGMRALAHAQFRLVEARELTALIRDTASSNEIAPLLGRICELACRMLGADFAVVTEPELGGHRARGSYGTTKEPTQWERDAINWPDFADAEPLRFQLSPDDEAPGLGQMPLFAEEHVTYALAVPLLPGDGPTAGVLSLAWRFPVDPSPHVVALAQTLGASATSLLLREKTQSSLRASELLWRTTLDNAPVGICLLTLDGRFQLVNAAMNRILGFATDELFGRHFESITLQSHAPEKQHLLRRLLSGAVESGTLKTQCIHKDGHNVWTTISAQLVPSDDGEPLFFSVQLEDITSQHEQNEQLVHLATHDSSTGLANRRLFQELLDGCVARSQMMMVALIDVPDLHGLEDRYGHLPAAEVVRAIARRLTAAIDCNASDDTGTVSECVARLGSDEFAVMLAPGNGESVDEMQDRLVGVFREPITVAGRTHRLPAHIGVAVSPGDGRTSQELMHSADIALTEARRDGRPLRAHSGELRERVQHRDRLSADLRHALATEQLVMAYQPIVDADTRHISAAEALARWTHPEFGQIPPDTFVPLAEETGLMPTLTSWAIDTAVRACVSWQADKPGVGVAVNLSASDLQDPAIAETVTTVLARHGLAAHLLELELTETTLMTDLGAAHAMLGALSRLGVGLGIDDFGTGYSSLAYLQRLPMMTLKIDRSFVTTMLSDAGNAAIVTMVLQLARTLGMGTVAEGVEDAATDERLTSMHCDRIQGYGVARPMSEVAFRTWQP